MNKLFEKDGIELGFEGMRVIEITPSNWEQYKTRMLNLEDKVKNNMIEQGIGNLFFTTGEDIKEYVDDFRHHVYVVADEQNNVLAQTYLIGAGSHIQGDYSDLPKYFTMGEDFLEYVKKYKYNYLGFLTLANSMYSFKLRAFKYALTKIYGKLDLNKFLNDLNKEKLSDTHFDERTQLRRDINKYMSEFMSKNEMGELYRQFYHVSSSSINFEEKSLLTEAYDSFLEASKVTVYSKKIDNPQDYYEASVDNTIEIDTYITDPSVRKRGLAKLLTTIALNKIVTEFFDNNESDVLYLSITLHKDNYLSENIANFLGFKDYIDLERRATIERKAYMKKIDRSTYKSYLNYLNKKLAYFYSYGTSTVTQEEQEQFMLERDMHFEEIVAEIDRRLATESFDDATRNFILNTREVFCGHSCNPVQKKKSKV